MQILFSFKKTTPNKVVFEEVGNDEELENPAVPSLYITKEALEALGVEPDEFESTELVADIDVV